LAASVPAGSRRYASDSDATREQAPSLARPEKSVGLHYQLSRRTRIEDAGITAMPTANLARKSREMGKSR